MKSNKLIIRLQKMGRIRRPYYYVVVTEAHKSPKAGFLARVGFYDPFTYKYDQNINTLVIYKDILNFWIAKGARPDRKLQRLLF